MLERRPRVPRVVDAEREQPLGLAAACQLAEQRIVGVHDEQRVGQRRDRRAPALGDQLELAVAVELVAEEVAERDRARAARAARPRAARPRRPRTGRAARRGPRAGWRRRPRRGSRPSVVGDRRARAQDLRRHRRGRRLAVRRRDERRAERQPRGQPVDRVRVRFPEQLARQRRPAAAPGEARNRADRACSKDLDAQRQPRVHRSRVPRPIPRTSELHARSPFGVMIRSRPRPTLRGLDGCCDEYPAHGGTSATAATAALGVRGGRRQSWRRRTEPDAVSGRVPSGVQRVGTAIPRAAHCGGRADVGAPCS